MPVEILSYLDQHVLALQKLKDADKVLRLACVNGVAIILHRIQQKGKNSADTSMAEYSKKYKRRRAKKGLQVEQVDLTFTGQLTQNFKVIPLVGMAYGLGFDNELATAKAGWVEEQYGEIFTPTKKENETIIESIQNAVLKILNKRQ